MDSTTRGLTKYLKGYYTWYMKNSLILLSVPPFVRVTHFRTEPAEERLCFKVGPMHCHRVASTWGHFHPLTSPEQTALPGKSFGLIMLQAPARGSPSAKQHLPLPAPPEERRSSATTTEQQWGISYVSASEKKTPNLNKNPHSKLISLPLLISSGITDCQTYGHMKILLYCSWGQGGWPSLQLDMKAICGY